MNLNRRDWLTNAGWLGVASGIRSRLAAAPASASSFPLKSDFPITKTSTCLNAARSHPLSIGSMRAMQEYLEFKAQGVRGARDFGPAMQNEVKTMFAKLINASPPEISFVASTQTGENLVVSGLDIPRSGGNVVTDGLHYESSTYMYRTLEKQGLDLRVVMPREWRITLADMEKAIDKKTKLVALSLVSYVNGFQHDLKAVCDLAHAHGAHVYADIIQAAGAIPIDVRASGVDFCACSTFKWLMGDPGLGFFYVREELLDRVIRRTHYGQRQFRNFEDHIFPYDSPSKSPAT